MKYFSIILTKYVQILFEESHKTPMNEIKDTNKWRDSPRLCIGRFNIVSMSVLYNMIYQHTPNQSPSNLVCGFQ